MFFMTWARKTVTKFNRQLMRQRNAAAHVIIRFFRQFVMAVAPSAESSFVVAVKMFIQKRGIINDFVQYEKKRKRTLDVVRKQKVGGTSIVKCDFNNLTASSRPRQCFDITEQERFSEHAVIMYIVVRCIVDCSYAKKLE